MNNLNIPKVIHYCWFGKGEMPNTAIECINSWKKFFPDYQIKRWDETNFDLSSCKYIEEAYKMKKWAFVSDYARFKILYEEGGIYFDTDVKVISSFDQIIENGPFLGTEIVSKKFYPHSNCNIAINPGLGLAALPKMNIIKSILDKYHSNHFINEDGSLNLTTIVYTTTEIFVQNGYDPSTKMTNVSGFNIYPPDFFGPMNYLTGETNITDNTKSIHLYTASWLSKREKKIHTIRSKISKAKGIIKIYWLLVLLVQKTLKKIKL